MALCVSVSPVLVAAMCACRIEELTAGSFDPSEIVGVSAPSEERKELTPLEDVAQGSAMLGLTAV
jgi:hypothetical protein